MGKILFQIIGVLVLIGAGLMLLISLVSLRTFPPPANSGLGFVRVGAFVGGLAVIGWGIYVTRKWAAIMFSAAALCLALWITRIALQDVPGRNNRVGLIFSAVLVAPALITLKYWRILK